jgi:hypothetical protein
MPQSSSGPVALPPAPVTETAAVLGLNVQGEQIAQVAAGLASLDVALPERGRLYRFTTPRGDIAITASAIPASALDRLIGLVAVLVAILAAWLLSREKSRQVATWLVSSTAGGVAVLAVGLVSLLLGILPLLGLVALVAGLAIVVRSRIRRPSFA